MVFGKRWVMAAAVIAAGIGGMAFADEIRMTDGRKFNGKMSVHGDMVTIITDDGATLEEPARNVANIKQVGVLTQDELAESEWKRVAALSKRSDDLQAVIAMHEGYLKRFPETKSTEAAKTSLAAFRELGKQGAVKFRGEWVSQAKVAELKNKWVEDAKPAVDFYKEGRMKDSLEAVKVALGRDALNPDALMVGGLAAFRTNSLPLSTRYFLTLESTVQGSLVAENNLAVLHFQQKLHLKGMGYYLKAMQIMPGNRMVLDNVAEAINSFDQNKKADVFVSVTRLYEQATAKMEADMSKKGQYRWGSTWVTQEQLASLNAIRNQVKTEMAQLEGQYKAAKGAIPRIDDQIKEAEKSVTYYDGEANALVALPVGPGVGGGNQAASRQTLRAQALANLEQARTRKAGLEQQKTQLIASMTEMETRAKRLKEMLTLSEPQYTGVQRIMEAGDVEHPSPPVPLLNPPQGTTASGSTFGGATTTAK